MPESSRYAEPEGGKLAGIRMIVVGIPWPSRTSQNGVPWRNSSMPPPDNGMSHLPNLRVRLGSIDFEVER